MTYLDDGVCGNGAGDGDNIGVDDSVAEPKFQTQIFNALKDKRSPKQKFRADYNPQQHTKIPVKAAVPVRHLFNMLFKQKDALTKLRMLEGIFTENLRMEISQETANKMDLIGIRIDAIQSLINAIVLEEFEKISLGDDENIILFKGWTIGYRT